MSRQQQPPSGDTPAAMSGDPMAAIVEAVGLGATDPDAARARLTELWAEIGDEGDLMQRCTLAHYFAELHDDPADALEWNLRAVTAADALTAADSAEAPDLGGFHAILHLALADNHRRLGSWDAAAAQTAAARTRVDALTDDPYSEVIRIALDELDAAITARRAEPLTGALGLA